MNRGHFNLDGLENLTDFIVREMANELLEHQNIPDIFSLNACRHVSIWSAFYIYRLKMLTLNKDGGLFDVPNHQPVVKQIVMS